MAGRLDAAARANSSAAAAVVRSSGQLLDRAAASLRRDESAVAHGALIALERSRGQLVSRAQRAAGPVRAALDGESARTAHRRELLGLFDPRRQLERGWTLTRVADGTIVRSAAALAAGATITTTFADGSARSSVESVEVDAAGATDGRHDEHEGAR